MSNVNKLSKESFNEIKQILAATLSRVRAFSLPEEGETYSFVGIKEVDLPNRDEAYKAIDAKTSVGTKVTFWPSWLYANILDVEGVRHVSTLDGEPINEIDEDFPSAVKCESVEHFNALRNIYDKDGSIKNTAPKSCSVYHWVSVVEE